MHIDDRGPLLVLLITFVCVVILKRSRLQHGVRNLSESCTISEENPRSQMYQLFYSQVDSNSRLEILFFREDARLARID